MRKRDKILLSLLPLISAAFVLLSGGGTIVRATIGSREGIDLKGSEKEVVTSIFCPHDASANTKLAAKEIRRYVYLRTGTLLKLVDIDTRNSISFKIVGELDEQQYCLESDGRSLVISGGSDIALLYGAYAFAEKLGVRFYLHGDVIPDFKIPFVIPQLHEIHKPLFELRGVNPWGSHPFGFDAWSTDDYKAIFTQLTKMKMNFLGIHCYPQGKPYTEYTYPTWAEPTVWHGLPGDFDALGRVTVSYKSRYYNTAVPDNYWGGYFAGKTSDYGFGGSQLFESDDWAPSVMAGNCPEPTTPEACNEVFNRTGAQFRDAFSFARLLGVKTCIGTEVPLILPKTLRENLIAAGKNPEDPAVIREIYAGTFKRIMAAHPLDYYWLWTPESWTWEGNKPEEYQATVADIKLAIGAAEEVGAPFRLATCGWVLGPAHDRSAFDNDLPKNIPMSAISRAVGYTPVDPAFANISSRGKWAIPWLESDSHQGLAGIQLEAGRMRRDAVDALAYGCTGLMGLHWRTEIPAPNASALALAAWDQSWNSQSTPPGRSLPCDDFYADFAQASFGLEKAGKVFAGLDGKVPLAGVTGCPAMTLPPDETPWDKVAPQYAFVDEMATLRLQIKGSGNLERFDYWLNTFRYYRALAQTRCAMGSGDPGEILKCWTEAYTCLLATVNSPGALAMVVNMENQAGTGPVVARAIGKPFPKEYQGHPRIIVPCVRSVVTKGEALTLKIIALSNPAMKSVSVHIRPLGRGKYQIIEAYHLSRAIWSASLPVASEDIEYLIVAKTSTGTRLVWPATAPELNQSIIVRD